MSIPVESARFPARFTGNVNPAQEWITAADGTRSRSNVQPTDENGVPLWNVEIVFSTTVYGEDRVEAVTVEVPHASKPAPAPFASAAFEGLTVEHYVSQGRLRSRWAASGLTTGKTAETAKAS